ncbi:HD domain-containing protein [bacterium]|nr:HD domain-containing protein [bacterium]
MGELVSFADVAHPNVSFSQTEPADRLVLALIDTPWFQRLRDISQTANTRLVYMFSEHSRFGHCVGVAYLAKLLLNALEEQYRNDSERGKEVRRFRTAIQAAALLHDIGHLAPGSHTAYKTWFPEAQDIHERLGCRILREDREISTLLASEDEALPSLVEALLQESDTVPPWTWQVLSGGGWNCDRGNWCVVDSVLAGVDYGRYNVAAILGSFHIAEDGQLALRENRLDALMHFAISRHAMYRQLYQHRTLMAADMLNGAVVQRVRDLGRAPNFADEDMQLVLAASSPLKLPLPTLFRMREPWWRYHLMRWAEDEDQIVQDLAHRLLHRSLLKTVRILSEDNREELFAEARQCVLDAGYDPKYYLHRFRLTHMHRGDSKQALMVQQDDGKLIPLSKAEPLFEQLVAETEAPHREWIALPAEAKAILGRER